jgi:hypothetical protein
MASKSRFGFFSILPSHTAGITDYAQKTGITYFIIQPIKISQEKLSQSLREFTRVRSPLKYSARHASRKLKAPLLAVRIWILASPKSNCSCKRKRNGPKRKYSNLLDWKKHCKFIPYSRISSSYPYKSMKPEDKTKKYRN